MCVCACVRVPVCVSAQSERKRSYVGAKFCVGRPGPVFFGPDENSAAPKSMIVRKKRLKQHKVRLFGQNVSARHVSTKIQFHRLKSNIPGCVLIKRTFEGGENEQISFL